MSFRVILIIIAMFSALTESLAAQRRYIAPMEDSRWEMTVSTGVQCEMEHVIPYFGKAIFSQEAGRKLRLKLVTQQRFKPGIEVELFSESPIWKTTSTVFSIGNLKTGGGEILIDVPTVAAKFAYLELHDGYQAGFYFPVSQDDLIDSVLVSMSTVRFRSVQPLFEQCVGGLYPENFEDIRSAGIHFDHDDEFPRIEEEDSAFLSMFNYLKVDNEISKIVISGHADFSGSECYNDTLSSRRAWYVYDMLVSNDIDPSKIQVKYFGETRPVTRGKSEADLLANRRVTVELYR